MKCPVCAVELRMMERQKIEIDYCPQCRGVWLDRGELDKLIERSMSVSDVDERSTNTRPDWHDDDYRHDRPRHKKKSFLGDMFEIFD